MLYTSEPIILASSSPRRQDFLRTCGITFTVSPADISEEVYDNEAPRELVARLAKEKAEAVAHRYPNQWIIAADTVVAQGSTILGKPVDDDDAIKMLSLIQGKEHSVWGGIAVYRREGEELHVLTQETVVSMRSLLPAEIAAYVKTGEPGDKAGAYALQGMAAAFITGVRGSHTNVIGLDLGALLPLLLELGIIRPGV